MDFPIAPAIIERLSRRVAVDVGYPTWDDVSRSPLPERFAERMTRAVRLVAGPGAAARAGRRPAGRRPGGPPPHRAGRRRRPPRAGLSAVPRADPGDADGRSSTCRRCRRRTGSCGTTTSWTPGSPREPTAGRARLWILCHPQNPTGRVFERAELERDRRAGGQARSRRRQRRDPRRARPPRPRPRAVRVARSPTSRRGRSP